MSGAWGCPHDLNGICQKVLGAVCAPGMRGCVMEGKVRFANEALNLPRKPVKAEPEATPDKRSTKPRHKLPF